MSKQQVQLDHLGELSITVLMLHDKKEIAAFFRQDVFLHIYGLGDLDDFFWNYTTWYGAKQNDCLQAVVLLYTGQSLPVLLALANDLEAITRLLRSISHLLPVRFYAHLSPGLERILTDRYHLETHGEHYKMGLRHRAGLSAIDCSQVERLAIADLADILTLYELSYPGNWFDPRMLETRQYFGIRENKKLVSIAGIHVFSRQYRVAALGNITTHPNYRGNGLAKAVTARLCTSLAESVDYIGLNVKSDNRPAIALYQQLGFTVASVYGEYMVEVK